MWCLRGGFTFENFEIAVDPKGPPSGPTFWLGSETPNHKGCSGGHAHFPSKSDPNNQN